MDISRVTTRTALLLSLLAVPFAQASAGGKPPVVTNEPVTAAEADSTYVYQINAWDPEGDDIEFRIRNRPSWLYWKREKGRLFGEPSSADVGLYSDIRIEVSDGTNTTVIGPFDIYVAGSEQATSWSTSKARHPGHYISLNRYDDHSDMISAIKPGVKGFQRRYFWKWLEPEPGNYDFSRIWSDLKLAASQGMQLVIFIEDKSFNNEYPTPRYLHLLTAKNRNRGYTALRWKPFVRDRFSALLAALGEKFDSHPNVEGIAIQESSLGLTDTVLNNTGYSPELYRDALISAVRAGRRSFPESQVFWYMNFLPRNQNYISNVANVAAKLGVAMGGPDVLPDSDSLRKLSYPYYDEYRWRMTLFNSMQYDSYAHERDRSWGSKYWTMKELFVYARDELHVDYLFWNRKMERRPSDSHNFWDAVPVIGDNPWFGNAH